MEFPLEAPSPGGLELFCVVVVNFRVYPLQSRAPKFACNEVLPTSLDHDFGSFRQDSGEVDEATIEPTRDPACEASEVWRRLATSATTKYGHSPPDRSGVIMRACGVPGVVQCVIRPFFVVSGRFSLFWQSRARSLRIVRVYY